MPMDMLLTFLILIAATLFFISGKVRADIVAVGSLLALFIAGILTSNEILTGFSNSIVIMIASLFIVGAGIFNTGLAKQIGNQLLRLAGDSQWKLFMIIIIVVGGFSGFLSNTGTVAVLLPVVLSICMKMKANPSQFLIPLAYASSLGGMMTLIGTPPNIVISEVLLEYNFEPLSFFDFMPIGLVALLVGGLFLLFTRNKLLPNHQTRKTVQTYLSSTELISFYELQNKLHYVRVTSSSNIIGQTLEDIKLSEKYKITIVEVHRRINDRFIGLGQKQLTANSNTMLQENDCLLLFGDEQVVHQFISEYELEQANKENRLLHDDLVSKKFGLLELFIPPHSKFHNKTIAELHFREKYHCNVVAINKRGKFIVTNIKDVKLSLGDALLIHGDWDDIELLANEKMDVISGGDVSTEAKAAYAKGKAPIAAAIMIFMLSMMIFEIVPTVVAVMISAFLMIITGCIKSISEAYQQVNWEAVVLIAAMLPMATALEKTGGIAYISDGLLSTIGELGTYPLLIGFYLITMLLSQFISNTATAVIFAPIAITTAMNIGVSPYPFLMAVAISASMAFATPVASPTNALVMTAGGYSFSDYVKVGVPLQLVLGVVMLILIPLLFPF
ncbi:SLC13 family permease [Chengkuizengella axinellae]|uniref:SLC13 family permease n=1 Tax=Chengkuizengella axinellae TaxID=3064388 RepID=A0ABT9J4X8_9BACL|nr:SLC13 family permease [Chengkuizengella sp. 2205SS18-9]MDP5275999.1 SLC13 family permease [Chengkuizengella sp. 2205SS18-9]